MAEPKAAKEFLQNYLSENIKAQINLDTLQLQKESFIDEQLRSRYVDLLYSVNFKNTRGYVYVLFEHLSNPDKLIAFRLFKYMLNIMEHHLCKNKDNKNNAQLPIIYPIVLYTGHKKYTSATSIFDLFEENKNLAQDIFLKPYHFINVHEIPDEKLNNQIWFGLLGKIFKNYGVTGVYVIRAIKSNLFALDQNGCIELINAVLKYVIASREVNDRNEFFEEAISCLSKESGEKIMTLGEELRAEGRDQGLLQGRSDGLREGMQKALKIFVLNLLKENEPIEKITKLTGLSANEINKMKTEKNSTR